MIEKSKIEKLVRKKVLDSLARLTSSQPVDFVNEKVVLAHENSKSILIAPGAIITPSAQDIAQQLDIQFRISSDIPVSLLEKLTHQTIVIGSDHGGYSLKKILRENLQNWGYPVCDVGTHNKAAVDYPDIAHAAASLVGKGHCQRGIILDGAGIGSAMVANKVYGVRAAHCHNLFEVRNSREHNNANILTLGARVIGEGLAIEMVRVWLKTDFAGGRHQKRVDKIGKFEKRG